MAEQQFGGTATAVAASLKTEAPTTTTQDGDCLVCIVGARVPSGDTISAADLSITDSAGNVWPTSPAGTVQDDNKTDATIAVFVLCGAASIESGTGWIEVTSSSSPAPLMAISVLDFSGVVASSVVGVTATDYGVSTSPSTGTTATTTEPSIAIVAFGEDGSSVFSAFTSGYEATTQEISLLSGQNVSVVAAYNVDASVGTQSCSATLGTSENWGGIIVTLATRNLLIPSSGALFGGYPYSGNLDPNLAPTGYTGEANSFEGANMADRQVGVWSRYYKLDETWPTSDDLTLIAAGRRLAVCWSCEMSTGSATVGGSGLSWTLSSPSVSSGSVAIVINGSYVSFDYNASPATIASDIQTATGLTVSGSGSHLNVGTVTLTFTGTGPSTFTSSSYAYWTDVAAGTYDSDITATANAVLSAEVPIFIGLNNEFDGTKVQGESGYSTAGVLLTGSDLYEAYVDYYQHIVNIFRTQGATNAIFCWVVSGSNRNSATASMYPGDTYVDWIGFDPYDPTLSKGTPLATYTPFLSWMAGSEMSGADQGVGKPAMLFETGTECPPAGVTIGGSGLSWTLSSPTVSSGQVAVVVNGFNVSFNYDASGTTIASDIDTATGLAVSGSGVNLNTGTITLTFTGTGPSTFTNVPDSEVVTWIEDVPSALESLASTYPDNVVGLWMWFNDPNGTWNTQILPSSLEAGALATIGANTFFTPTF